MGKIWSSLTWCLFHVHSMSVVMYLEARCDTQIFELSVFGKNFVGVEQLRIQRLVRLEQVRHPGNAVYMCSTMPCIGDLERHPSIRTLLAVMEKIVLPNNLFSGLFYLQDYDNLSVPRASYVRCAISWGSMRHPDIRTCRAGKNLSFRTILASGMPDLQSFDWMCVPCSYDVRSDVSWDQLVCSLAQGLYWYTIGVYPAESKKLLSTIETTTSIFTLAAPLLFSTINFKNRFNHTSDCKAHLFFGPHSKNSAKWSEK